MLATFMYDRALNILHCYFSVFKCNTGDPNHKNPIKIKNSNNIRQYI